MASSSDSAAPDAAADTATVGIDALPHTVALHIFALLPADARARAALVCRAWRDAIAEPSVWTRLDLSLASGVTVAVTDAVLRGAAARARGRVAYMVLPNKGRPGAADGFSMNALVEVVEANAHSLRQLHCVYEYEAHESVIYVRDVELLARAAPQLRVFCTDAQAPVAGALRLLRKEAPFQALRLRHLEVFAAEDEDDDDDDADALALVAAMAAHTSLRHLCFNGLLLRTPAVLGAVAAAGTAIGLTRLRLHHCGLSSASVPALLHLLRSGTLSTLWLNNDDEQLFDAPSGLQFADAVAAHQSLRRLNLMSMLFWNEPEAAAAVMRAVTGHRSLHALSVSMNDALDPVAAGAALGALVAANTPALRELHCRDSVLGDAGLLPLFEALPHNTHLQLLSCFNTGMSQAFARDVFSPAVRANTSLRELEASESWAWGESDAPPEVLEAEALVAARGQRDLLLIA